jgi:hypothetical protein
VSKEKDERTVLRLERNKDFTALLIIDRVDTDTTQEFTSRPGNTDQEQEDGSSDRRIDTILDSAEHGNEDGSEPDEEFEGVDAPKGVHLGRWGDEVSDGVDDDGRETGERDEEESIRQTVEGDDDDDTGDPTSSWSTDTALGLEGGAREGSGGGVGTKDGSDSVGNSDGCKQVNKGTSIFFPSRLKLTNQLLVGVDLVSVNTTERLGDGNVLEEQDEGRDEQVRAQSAEELGVNVGLADMLEATGHGLEDLNGVVALAIWLEFADVEPSGEGEDDDHKGVTHHANVEKGASTVRVALGQKVKEPSDKVEGW